MAGSVNKCIIIGNLGADPEVRALPSGNKVVNMRVACSESWRDKNTGERKERTEWISVVVFNEGLAKIAEQYLHKGSKVYLEGSLQTRKWQDQAGNDRYSTEVVLQAFNGTLVMLDGLQSGDSRNNSAPERSSRAPAPAFDAGGMDDEIPFHAEMRG